MALIAPGTKAPPVPGVAFDDGPTVLFFYKIDCPVCQMSAPYVETFEHAYPGHISGVGEDPEPDLADFARRFGMTFRSVSDLRPYEASDAYGLEVVPTLVLVGDDGTVVDAVESWSREGFNRVSRRVAELTESEYVLISEEGDGLPPFRPG